MNDIKVYIKADPSKELPKEPNIIQGDYLTNVGHLTYEGENKWYCDNTDKYHNIKFWLKEVFLTELMVGFAEWAKKDELKAYRKQIKPTELEELLEIYLQSKGVVL